MGEQVTVVIESEKAISVNRNVAGVNCERAHLPHNGNDYNQDAFIEMIRDAGGTVSNYYHPLSGLVVPVEGLRDEHRWVKMKQKILDEFGESGWNDDNFYEMVHKTGIKYTLVLNVFTATIQENKKALEIHKSKGHPVEFVEIGNEVFFREYTQVVGGVAVYLEKAQAITAIVRELFPTAKIGVCIPNHVYQHKYVKGRGKPDLREWLSVLASHSEFYDAVIFHAYSANGTADRSKVVPPFDAAMKAALSYVDEQLDRTLDFVEGMYPGKEIWLTEYGVAEFPPGPLRAEFAVGKKYCGSLHNVVFLMKLLQRPIVTIAHWHSFSKFAHHRRRGKERTVTMKQFSFISNALAEAEKVIPVTLGCVTAGGQTEQRQKALEVLFLSKKGHKKGKLLVVNKSDEPVSIDRVAWARQEREIELKKGQVRIIGPKLDVSMCDALANSFDVCEEDHHDHCEVNVKVRIPAYGFASVSIEP